MVLSEEEFAAFKRNVAAAKELCTQPSPSTPRSFAIIEKTVEDKDKKDDNDNVNIDEILALAENSNGLDL